MAAQDDASARLALSSIEEIGPATEKRLKEAGFRSIRDLLVRGPVDVAEATAYLAGTRSAYVSVVLPIEVEEQVWASRVRRRAAHVTRVLSSSGRGPDNIRGIGTTTWSALHELLSEVSQSRFISKFEQRFAMMTAAWMSERLKIDRNHQRLA